MVAVITRRCWQASFLLAAITFLCSTARSATVINDDFSTDTRSNYTALGVHITPTRTAASWVVGGGQLHVVEGAQGMLAFEDASGNLLATPDRFSISFRYIPDPNSSSFPQFDHPGIAFDRTASRASLYYLRSHSDEAVAAHTSAATSSLTYDVTKTVTGNLTLNTSYDLTFEIDYTTLTASVTARSVATGAVVATSNLNSTQFTKAFGSTNSGGAFGLMGFRSEGAWIDNLVVLDLTITVPEARMSALLLAAAALLGLGRSTRG